MKLRDVVVAVVLLTIASIALYPSWVRARVFSSAAQAIGDTRSVISANQTYASANCGMIAEDLVCMTRSYGPICIPDYPDEAPEFLGPDLGRPSPYVKSGYQREYEGFDVVVEVEPGCAPRSPRFSCYASWPARPGLTGTRSFVGTMTGVIFEDPYGGDTRCVAVSTAGEPSWGPLPNAHPLGSEVLLRVHARRDFKRNLFEVSAFFLPTFLVVFVATFARRALDSVRALGACLAVVIVLALFIPDSLGIVLPLAFIIGLVPKGPPRKLRTYIYLILLTIVVSIVAKAMLHALIRA